ncbi:MAG: Hsp20/alpha crystallin family protein [Bryobacteraceae bacterium]
MANVAVEKCPSSGALPETLWRRMNAITDEIRQRAFSLFEGRGRTIGMDLGDWLQAEREVAWSPASELVEKQDDFCVRLALPGFDARDLDVTATPNALIVEAESAHTHEGKEGEVCLCEFSGKKLFRRLDLPSEIDVNKVTASLDKGILEIDAPKAAQSKRLQAVA